MPTGAGSHWDIVGSANLTDGAATTNVAGLTDENTTFVAGQVKDTGNQTTGINLTVAEFTEIEFAVQPTLNATDDTTYCFRMTHAGSTTFFTYSVYGQARVGKPDVEQIHYRFRNDDGNEAAATWAAAEDTLLPYFPRLKVRRLRFEISNEGTSVANAFTYRLEVSGPNPLSCVAATYAAVPTGAGSHWQIMGSANLTDGAATTNVAPGLTDENINPNRK